MKKKGLGPIRSMVELILLGVGEIAGLLALISFFPPESYIQRPNFFLEGIVSGIISIFLILRLLLIYLKAKRKKKLI